MEQCPPFEPHSSFFYLPTEGKLVQCRDSVLYYHKRRTVNRLFYCPSTSDYEAMIDNICKFTELFLSESGTKEKFKIKKTTNKKVICVDIDEYWSILSRFSLLTGLLRVGQRRLEGTINNHITLHRIYDYFKTNSSNYAFLKFMDGYHYIKFKSNCGHNEFHGWQHYFDQFTSSQIDDLMSKEQSGEFK